MSDANAPLLSGPSDGPHRRRGQPLHITFVCTGNICRSPMAEKMFADQLRRRGLGDAVRVTSAGTGNWHVGECADRRATDVLRAHGYPTDHSAGQVDTDHLAADLVIALDYPRLTSLGRLLRRTATRIVDRRQVCNGNVET